MERFLLSGTLFNTSIQSVSVIHDVDNTSDHEPIILQLKLDATYIGQSQRVFTSRLSWAKASTDDLVNYRINLSYKLADISIPVDVILCHNLTCHNCEHAAAINKYAEDITQACLTAGDLSIPHTTRSDSCRCPRVPDWTERVEPLREKSLFWHNLWVDCGRPRDSAVAACMCRTGALRPPLCYTSNQTRFRFNCSRTYG